MKFNDRDIKKLKIEEKRYERMEAGRKGFGIRVSTKGVKTWIYIYWFNGKKRRMTLGQYPAVTLSEAHAKYSEAELKKIRGIDPGEEQLNEKNNYKEADTISTLIDAYLRSIKDKKKTAYEDERTFNKDVIPKWGTQKARSITRKDINALLDKIVERGSPKH